MTDKPDPDLVARAKTAAERAFAAHHPTAVRLPDEVLLPRLERALTSMPRVPREIFLAHRLDPMSYAQISEVTGRSVPQVQRHFRTALIHMVRYIEGDERTAWQRWWQSHRPRWFD